MARGVDVSNNGVIELMQRWIGTATITATIRQQQTRPYSNTPNHPNSTIGQRNIAGWCPALYILPTQKAAANHTPVRPTVAVRCMSASSWPLSSAEMLMSLRLRCRLPPTHTGHTQCGCTSVATQPHQATIGAATSVAIHLTPGHKRTAGPPTLLQIQVFPHICTPCFNGLCQHIKLHGCSTCICC